MALHQPHGSVSAAVLMLGLPGKGAATGVPGQAKVGLRHAGGAIQSREGCHVAAWRPLLTTWQAAAAAAGGGGVGSVGGGRLCIAAAVTYQVLAGRP
jgi:hypothetical protein